MSAHFMGPAITEEFCREGASVALHDRDEAGARALRAIASGSGATCSSSPATSRARPRPTASVQAVVARFGRLDILVNNNAHPAHGQPDRADHRRGRGAR